MLNAKYIINRQGNAQQNPFALGNAWFIDSVYIVDNADQEISQLNNIDTRSTAVIDKRYESQINNLKLLDKSNSTIILEEYKPNYLKYNSN